LTLLYIEKQFLKNGIIYLTRSGRWTLVMMMVMMVIVVISVS